MFELRENLIKEFAEVINRNSIENYTDTPDFILAEYLVSCLENYEILYNKNKKWHSAK